MKNHIDYSKEWEGSIEAGSNLKADYCLRCKGDSMINARIFDGDIVFIKQQPVVENGEIAAVVIDDDVTLKRVYFYPEENTVILQPENPPLQTANLFRQRFGTNKDFRQGCSIS